MTLADLCSLARVLGALLPQRTLGALAHAPQEVSALAERLQTARLTAGVAEQNAARIAASLSGYLCGWGRRSSHAEAWTAQGTALLTFAHGGPDEDVVLLVPYGVALTDEAIAQLLSWALLEELAEEA